MRGRVEVDPKKRRHVWVASPAAFETVFRAKILQGSNMIPRDLRRKGAPPARREGTVEGCPVWGEPMSAKSLANNILASRRGVRSREPGPM